MEKKLFSPMETDALGEMMNISLGSSATAVSNLLEHRVDITTPTVSSINVADFVLGNLEPAMGIEIKYVEGLSGSNIMLLKRSDIKVIVDILMGGETPDEEFELNELTISAVCEVMNQMMGAAATAMSDFLGYQVDISTPQPFELEDLDAFKKNHLPQGAETIVIVRFSLKIEGALESEFMNVMSVELAKDLLRGLGLEEEGEEDAAPAAPAPAPAPAPEPAASSGGKMSQEEIEAMLAGMSGGEPEPAPAPAPEPASSGGKMSQEEIEAMLAGMSGGEPEPAPAPAPEPASSGGKMSQAEIEAMMANMAGGQPAPAPAPQPAPQPAPVQQAAPAAAPATAADLGAMMAAMMTAMTTAMANNNAAAQAPAAPAPEPKVINTRPAALREMAPADVLGKEQAQNLDLIMEVPLQVTVEIGRTQRKVQDILEFSKGSLVVLDKLAGDQVDLFVNGKCVARGDVVVIDDNFGVRITEIVQDPVIELVKK
ncbi:flagellar motor switch protein FliN [Oscillospiraceae bacterium 38-13]